MLVWIVQANNAGVRNVFFGHRLLFAGDTWHTILKGFWINVQVFIWAEIIVLVWALLVAVVRLLPGPACAPIRWLATAYVDIFRGIPSVLVILLVGLGLPQANVPLLGTLSDIRFAVLALSLTYGAYVSEVYRAGIESVHLGADGGGPLARPQPFRDDALRRRAAGRAAHRPAAAQRLHRPAERHLADGFLGILDVINRARFANNTAGSLTAYTMAALLFLAVTIPFTRYLDYILRKQKLLTQAGV